MKRAVSVEFKKTFTRRLRVALFEADVRQQELAAAVGVLPPAVSAWTNGSSLPGLDKIPVICRALHVSPAWLLGMTDDMTEAG